MKKLSILLLALAFAAMLAVPAMAGDLSVDGEYTFGGERWSVDQMTPDEDYGLFYDEFDVNVDLTVGDVTGHWELVLYDDSYFDRSTTDDDLRALVDMTMITWSVNDALSVQFGDYGIAWGNDLVVDDAGKGSGTIGILYSLDAADLAFYLSRDQEGREGVEDDNTTMGVTAEGEIGPAEVGLIYLQTTNDLLVDSDWGLVDVYGNFTVGPVGVTLEYGSVSADFDTGDGGTIILAEFGLGDLVGFDCNVGLVQTNEDWYGTPYDDDFDRAKIYDLELNDMQMVYANAEYGVDDATAVGIKAILMNDVGGDDGPTEIDGYVTHSFADNVNVEAGYASMTGNDADVDATLMWYEFVFGL